MSDIDALLDPFVRLLDDVCTPAILRGCEVTGEYAPISDAVAESGYLDALRPESDGGAGLTLLEAEPLIRALGYHGAPVALAEAITGSSPNRNLGAVAHSVMIAGAAARILDMCLAYANDRVQFGKPIGKQQALQQNLSVMGEQVILARIAAQKGCTGGLNPSDALAAIAKYNASAAVPIITGIAHAVHGAIGITAEYDLQLFTRRLHEWRQACGSEGYWAQVLGQQRFDASATPSLDFVRAIAWA